MRSNVVPIKNPLAEYKTVTEDMKALEARKNSLREEIFHVMDSLGSDEVAFGSLKAKRSLVVQERFNSRQLKDTLGDGYKAFVSEVPVIRLAVI